MYTTIHNYRSNHIYKHFTKTSRNFTNSTRLYTTFLLNQIKHHKTFTQRYKALQHSTILHTFVHMFLTFTTHHKTLQNFTTLPTYTKVSKKKNVFHNNNIYTNKCTKLYKTYNALQHDTNKCKRFIKFNKLFNTVHNHTHLYTTSHNCANISLQTIHNFIQLYKTFKIQKTLQHFTQLDKTFKT